MFVNILYIAVRNLRIELKKEYAKSLTDLTQEGDWQIKQRNIKHFLIRFLWKLPRSLRIGMYVIDGFGGIQDRFNSIFPPMQPQSLSLPVCH